MTAYCHILLPRMTTARTDVILNGAARALWPVLAPLIDGMLRKGSR